MKTDVATQAVAQQALHDIQRYLADEIAPMMAADAAETLLRMPPKVGAAAIEHWLEEQLRAPDRAVAVSRYLYHAIKKFHVFTEFQLIDAKPMQRYLAELSRLMIELCPEREQAELRARLGRIGEAKTALGAPVDLLNREAGSGAEEEQIRLAEQAYKERSRADQPAVAPASPRVSALMERLGELREASPGGDVPEESQEVLAHLVSKAAIDANDSAEFDASLDNIRELGIEPKFDQVFRLLGQRLPGWNVDPRQGRPEADAALGHLVQAMHKIVALAGSSQDGAQRFGEMIYTAIEQFNDGHLAQAVAMFDVAQRLIEESKVDTHTANLTRTQAQGSVSPASLRQFASAPAKHGLLRKVLRFFPALTATSLLESLDGEKKREARKLKLSLIEVHGPPCRPALVERLTYYASDKLPDEEGFYSRNVIYLLRRIPLGHEDDQHGEFEQLSEFSRPDRPFMVTKEAVAALANLSLPKAEQVLIDRLAAFEKEALSRRSSYTPEELAEILDRTCAALAHRGTQKAVDAVVQHAFRRRPELGEPLHRLEQLAACDLSGNPDLLDKLLAMLKKTLPARVMGLAVGRKVWQVPFLIRALSGTPAPAVGRMFEEIVQRFPSHEFSEEVRDALAAFESKPRSETTAHEELSGDLEVFGLPTLMQSMADSELSGRLVITDENGSDRAIMLFAAGKIQSCEVGRLRGVDAVCQLFERPRPATFSFRKARPKQASPREEEPLSVMATILEAMRRHDEFNKDRALVPDGMSLMPGKAKPAVPEGEKDEELLRTVWSLAAKGTAPESCEGSVDGDAYRVRRLYAHWLECGALVRRPAA